MIVKVGDGYRVTIPSEIRHKLNINLHDNMMISIEGNKIILEKEENDSDDDLNDMDNENKSDLQKLLEKSREEKTYWDRTVIKRKQQDDYLKCSCGNDLGDSRFILNGEYVCRDCRNAFRDHIIAIGRYKKRLEQIKDS